MDQIALAADFAIIVVAATAVGLVARRLGQPTIVAYIATGVILGPVAFDVVTDEGLVDVMAELGLGFLLFLLGMKMRFDDIREILSPIVNVAVGQTVLQTALAFLVAYGLGFSSTEVIVIALATVFGATPVIVKVLTDKDEVTSLPGRIDVGVLIVQDIYLVVVLAMFSAEQLDDAGEIAVTLGVIFAMMGTIGIVSILSSRYLLPRLFRLIANSKDVFLVVAIAWAFLFIAIAEAFNLSVEVGAFLAGLSLAQLPYSKELEDRITPITDFFILVFFATIGLQIESAASLFAFWQEAVIASVVLMIGNFWIMFYLIDREGFSVETSFLASINMVQVSEFSLIVGALALTQGYIGPDVLGYLTLMALLTMTVSTYIIAYNHRLYARLAPYFDRFRDPETQDETGGTYTDHAVVIGYDAVTERVLPVLAAEFSDVVVVDRDPANATKATETEQCEFVFGDFRHREVRKAAGLSEAAFVFSSSVEPAVNKALLGEVTPETTVVVEAETVYDAQQLYEHGATYVLVNAHLAAEKLAGYLEAYLTDPSGFEAEISAERDRISKHTGDTEPPRPTVDPRELGGDS